MEKFHFLVKKHLSSFTLKSELKLVQTKRRVRQGETTVKPIKLQVFKISLLTEKETHPSKKGKIKKQWITEANEIHKQEKIERRDKREEMPPLYFWFSKNLKNWWF